MKISTKDKIEISILLIIEMVVVLLMCGCTTTKYVPVESVRDVYHNSVDTIRDSIYHDVFQVQYVKGDTVYNQRIEYQYRDRWRNHTDTLIKTDSIQVPYPVEKQLTKWQQLKQDWFDALICVLLAFLASLVIVIGYTIRTRQKQNS